MNRSFLLLILAFASAWAGAAPRSPVADSEVLERLPMRPDEPALRELRVLQAQLAQRRDNLSLAVEVARRYVELGRVSADPRYAGYAQAALAPWWDLRSPPRDVLVLRATLHQRVHRFDAALADLALALERNPRDLQARLTRATVLQVRGEFDAARRDCEALQGHAQELISTACLTSVESATGRLHEAYASLQAALNRDPSAEPSVRAWVLTALAEMAVRGGFMPEAERYFRAAREADPTDQYLIAAYADFLLDRGRAREAAALVKDRTRVDGLLLRYALALRAQGAAEADQYVEQLRARFEASRRRGDRVHLREEARFQLHLESDPRTALALAADNWTVQKEPADARILLEAALAANDHAAARRVAQWLTASRLEDVQLARLLAGKNPVR